MIKSAILVGLDLERNNTCFLRSGFAHRCCENQKSLKTGGYPIIVIEKNHCRHGIDDNHSSH